MNSEVNALLFINGTGPGKLPKLEGYNIVACTDGAFHYVKDLGLDPNRLTFISGDFDSHTPDDSILYSEKYIPTPDQNFTDFYKALEILHLQGATHVDVYGGSGGEMDHFLGNIHVAHQFKHRLELVFYDKFAKYFFLPNSSVIMTTPGQLVSLYPYPIARQVITKGLKWSLKGDTLDITRRIGTRNVAVADEIEISYSEGDLLLFIGRLDQSNDSL